MLMTSRGVNGLMHEQFKIGAQAGIAVAPPGSGVEAALAGPMAPDIVVWSSSSRLYGALTIDGSIIRPPYRSNPVWYGRPLTMRGIFSAEVVGSRSVALRNALTALG